MDNKDLSVKKEALALQKAKNRFGYVLSATAGLGAVKIGNITYSNGFTY
ncbi:MAG: hypothetical protein QXG00_07840 [Candidatus Woesearchaeota archaeon]